MIFCYFCSQNIANLSQIIEFVVSNTQKNKKKFGGLNLLSYIRTVKTETFVL